MAYHRPDEWGYASWSATGVGTNAGVSVTHTITAGSSQCVVSGIQCSGDAAAIVTIESPSGTAVWRKRFTTAFTHSEGFAIPVFGALNQNVLVKVSASTSNSEANIQGFDR